MLQVKWDAFSNRDKCNLYWKIKIGYIKNPGRIAFNYTPKFN